MTGNDTTRKHLNILIVEDDRDFAESLRLIFSLQGHGVDIAYSGEAALEAFQAERHSLVLMDIRLPGINGVETMRQIRSDYPALPILIMTGCERSSNEAEAARREGATDLLFKPFKISSLLDRVSGLIHH